SEHAGVPAEDELAATAAANVLWPMWRFLPVVGSGCFTGLVTSDPSPPDTGSWPHPAGGHVGASTEERNWAMAAHLGSLVAAWFALGLIAPLLVLLIQGDRSPYVRRHAVESLNFQINALLYTVVCFVLMFVLIGFALIVIYGIFYLVCVITATVRASNGADYRYPLTLRLVS
ncbi:MAG: DUF4870 domain-containing protein, partial [Actinomycetota bacterium]|nr:DUF4870 domain-containing protein [Actinomycetota bacterium]